MEIDYKQGDIPSNFEKQDLFLNAGKTAELDIYEIFKNSGINISKFKLESRNTDIVTVEKNVITAQPRSGKTEITCTLYDNETKTKHFAIVAYVCVIHEETMTHITTPQQLADITNDLRGHYILKSDIDLEDWGEWQSIGKEFISSSDSGAFEGIFVNPHGYKIKNLTITTSKERIIKSAALFNYLSRESLVFGLIVEDVFIDVSDYDDIDPALGSPALNPVGSPAAAGIAAHSQAKIIDCTVSGTILGGGVSTGGIVASNSGDIIGCNFTGTIKSLNPVAEWSFGVGGIAGYNSSSDDEKLSTAL